MQASNTSFSMNFVDFTNYYSSISNAVFNIEINPFTTTQKEAQDVLARIKRLQNALPTVNLSKYNGDPVHLQQINQRIKELSENLNKMKGSVTSIAGDSRRQGLFTSGQIVPQTTCSPSLQENNMEVAKAKSLADQVSEKQRAASIKRTEEYFNRDLSELYAIDKAPNNGDCFFEAIAKQVGKPMLQVREEIAAYMESHPDEYSWKVEGDFANYLKNLKVSSVGKANRLGWGGEVEAYAAAQIHKRPVTIFGYTGQHEYLPESLANQINLEASVEPIRLLYNETNHYDGLMPRTYMDDWADWIHAF